MADKVTLRDLQAALGIKNVKTINRWAARSLGHDPATGRSSGRVRHLTLQQALQVFLVGFLIRREGYSEQGALEIAARHFGSPLLYRRWKEAE